MQDSIQLSTHLHFGAFVSISCFFEKKNFYLYSNGISYRSIMSLADTDGPIQINQAIFQIKPVVKFQSQLFLKKILNEKYQGSGGQEILEKQAKAFIEQFDFQLNENAVLKEQQRKFHIKYGQNFMLQHKYSCRYLSYVKNQQNNQYSLQLSEIPYNSCIFNLLPCFNYQKDINTYIPFNSSAFLSFKVLDNILDRQLFLFFKPNSIFDSWNTSQEEKTAIRIGLYSTGEETDYKSVCYGDHLWIYHLQTGSFLKTVEKQENSNFILNQIRYTLGFINSTKNQEPKQPQEPKIIIQKTQNQNSAEKIGLWQVIYVNENKDQFNANAKQHKDIFRGGKIKFQQQVRFFSIRHKSYLSVVKKKINRKKFVYLLTTQKNQEPNTIFKIRPLATNNLYVTTEDLFLIQHVMSQTYLTLQGELGVGQTTAYLNPSPEYKKEDNFKFTKIQFQEEWQNSFILSILPFINEGITMCESVSNGLVSQKEQLMLQIVCENLIELLAFSYDLTEGFQASQSKLGKITYNHFLVQKLLREQGVLNFLIKLLKVINVELLEQNTTKETLKISGAIKIVKTYTSDVNNQKKNVKLDVGLLRKIVNVCLKILRNACRFNYQNTLIVLKQMEVCIKYLSLGTFAQTLFIDSFNNNDVVDIFGVQQFKIIIAQYVKIWKKTQIVSLEFFQLICTFLKKNQKGINKNQLELFKLFFQQKNLLTIPISPRIDKFTVTYQRQQYQLLDFFNEFPNHSTILCSQIKFYGFLTYDRNYFCSRTIKLMFPIKLMLNYLKKSLPTSLKEAFIIIIHHTYLNQRPRFKEKKPWVFVLQENRNFHLFNEKSNEKTKNSFEIQMQLMRKDGMSEKAINDVLSCIKQEDEITKEEIQQIKFVLVRIIEEALNNSTELYSACTQASLDCLKSMIELSVFDTNQTVKIRKIIDEIVQNIGNSMQSNSQKNVTLQSKTFKELLMQMVEKNIIKKSFYENKFDGREDQVNEDTICSIFVSSSFYQNIMLLEKNPKKRKQTDRVIQKVLKLVELYSPLILEAKMQILLKDINENEIQFRSSLSKNQLIKNIIIQKILVSPVQGKQHLYRLLLSLFYNSNSYFLNYASIDMFLREVNEQNKFLQGFQKVVFIIDPQEKDAYSKLVSYYKQLKLIIEKSEMWLTSYFEQNFQYNSIMHYFMDIIRKIINVIIPNYKPDYGFDGVKGLQKTIKAQLQLILNNLDFQEEVLTFLNNYKQLVKKIKQINPKNRLIIELFKCCFMFLYVYIYDSEENKKKVEESVDGRSIQYFAKYSELQMGQIAFLVEYLKNNYDECVEFYAINADNILSSDKYDRYTANKSKLLLVLLKFHNQPIQINLKKFFTSIFDFTSFKSFMWLKDGKQFELSNQRYYSQSKQQGHPLFYHINAIQALLYLSQNFQNSANTIRSHLKKSLSQEYLYGLLSYPDYFSDQLTRKAKLKIWLLFKLRIMKIIQFIYFQEDERRNDLIVKQLRKFNDVLNKFIDQAPARKETNDFRKVIPSKDLIKEVKLPQDPIIQSLYQSSYKEIVLHEEYINSMSQFCVSLLRFDNSQTTRQMCDTILGKIETIHNILHKAKFLQSNPYPIPFGWNLTQIVKKQQIWKERKKYTCSLVIETIFNQKVFQRVRRNEKQIIEAINSALDDINIKKFFFLRKISQFLEDAFEKLSSSSEIGPYNTITNLIKLLTMWLRNTKEVDQFRTNIGKSQLIYPILNYFQICHLDSHCKMLFLDCIQFFTEMIGENGNRNIQTIFNGYFTNGADSIDFFDKLKQILEQINLQDRVEYKSKKISNAMSSYKAEITYKKKQEFIVLNFMIALCKGNYKPNQIYLSSLSQGSNFNIMRGIWQILKYQSLKYPHNIINIENYHLITQCFSTIRELVLGPCEQNQNYFLNREFFLTIISFFQFQIKAERATLQPSLKQKLNAMIDISPSFGEKLEEYLNQDQITRSWMPSHVKYRCMSLICGLLQQNVNQKSKNQLALISSDLLIKELDKVYQKYVKNGENYTQASLEIQDQQEVVLPLGFKIYQVLQYFPPQKLSQNTPGLQFFRQNTRRVEVNHNNLCAVYFPRPPMSISEGFKHSFLQTVDRASVNSKLRDLQQAQIQNRQSDSYYGVVFFFLVIGVTITDFLLYTAQTIQYVKKLNLYPLTNGYAVYPEIQITRLILIIFLIVLSFFFFLLELKGAIYLRQTINKILSNEEGNLAKIKRLLILFKNNLSYFHYLLTLICCILGIFNPWFDVVLLAVELYRRSETFALILNAILSSLDQLLVVLILYFICTYILIAIIYYYEAQDNYNDQCQNLYHCYVFAMDIGFKADAGVVGFNDSDTILTDFVNKTIGDVLINFFYLFIIKVIIDQITGAIIVDKFAQMREETDKRNEDQDSVCFICGLERGVLDSQEDGFFKHKEEYHNVWSYFQFLTHLRQSKVSYMSGIQLFVKNQDASGKLKWFPINRSLHMEQKNVQQQQALNKVEDLLQRAQKSLNKEFNDLQFYVNQMWDLTNIKIALEKANNIDN